MVRQSKLQDEREGRKVSRRLSRAGYGEAGREGREVSRSLRRSGYGEAG